MTNDAPVHWSKYTSQRIINVTVPLHALNDIVEVPLWYPFSAPLFWIINNNIAFFFHLLWPKQYDEGPWHSHWEKASMISCYGLATNRRQGIIWGQKGLVYFRISFTYRQFRWVNPLRPSDAIWQHRSGSTLAQVMACCLTAPSHYMNKFWLIISKVLWH